MHVCVSQVTKEPNGIKLVTGLTQLEDTKLFFNFFENNMNTAAVQTQMGSCEHDIERLCSTKTGSLL
jgi:hypothetical protein